MGNFRGKGDWESSSMSGGEKSVTAVALILAIQKVNPHPFYLFDEIDQNLDQNNSKNLAEFFRERSDGCPDTWWSRSRTRWSRRATSPTGSTRSAGYRG